ncbi:putative pectinesterase [Helianthus annuus]|nr:putative pectinesterase [Helianthus annuus]
MMALPPWTTKQLLLLVVLIILAAACPGSTFASDDDQFVESVRSTIELVRQVISIVSRFSDVLGGGDFRASNAIADCLDLLDFSADQLTWTLSRAISSSTAKYSSSSMGADMRTWLGGALGNQDTCMEGFEGTNTIVKSLVAGSLDQVTSLVRQLLSQLPGTIDAAAAAAGIWLKEKEQKLLVEANIRADVVVAADGSGNFTRVMDAVSAAPDNSARYVIYVKKGVYQEYVEIGKKKTNIIMIGDGMNLTVISGDRSFVDGWTTYRSATFAVKGKGFMARDMRFENTAGPEKHQAVAFRSDSDLSVVYRCAITGYQDTLYAHSMRQFYRECLITGTVDFIFGDGVVVFQNCEILARRGLPNQKNTITAQGRKEPTQPSGFSIQFSNISIEEEEASNSSSSNGIIIFPPTYLGRPWKEYSRTVIMQSYISGLIRPQGWLEWNGDFALDTLYYGEYMNYGPGAALGDRIRWPGLHAINDSSEANNFTVAQFLLGNSWLPPTGVKYTAGLT